MHKNKLFLFRTHFNLFGSLALFLHHFIFSPAKESKRQLYRKFAFFFLNYISPCFCLRLLFKFFFLFWLVQKICKIKRENAFWEHFRLSEQTLLLFFINFFILYKLKITLYSFVCVIKFFKNSFFNPLLKVRKCTH